MAAKTETKSPGTINTTAGVTALKADAIPFKNIEEGDLVDTMKKHVAKMNKTAGSMGLDTRYEFVAAD